MSRTVELVYNRTGQTVDMYPPECVRDALGIPSSVTCSVFDGARSNDDTADFTPTVTVDATSTTVDVASGYSQTNRSRVNVAATTSVSPAWTIAAGTLYLLDNASGQREVIEPKKVNSGDSLDLVSDLQYDYAITVSTVKGIKCSWTVDATWVATESNILLPSSPSYRVVWTYTVAGVERRYQTYLRLVRLPFKSNVTAFDLMERWGTVLAHEPSDQRGERFQRAINAAEDDLRIDIIAEGYRPEQIHDTEIVDQLVRLRAIYVIANQAGAPGTRDVEAFLADVKREYGELFAKTISQLKVAIDRSSEGATAQEPIHRYVFTR